MTNTNEVASTWLVELIVSKILQQDPSLKVLVVQFFNRTVLHERGIKKYGVDVESPKKTGQLELLDLSQALFKTEASGFKPCDLTQLYGKIKAGIKDVDRTVVLWENFDTLVMARYPLDSVLQLLHQLQTLSSAIYVFLNSDFPLVTPGTPLADQYITLLGALFAKSSLVVSLRPLETGRADDVTGVLRITRGPRKTHDFKVIENEYLYFVTTDNVKIIHR